jgi:hypothetical protein
MGRCLISADWMGIDLARRDFAPEDMAQGRVIAYDCLNAFEDDDKIIRLGRLMCDRAQCKAHLGTTRLY